MKKISNEKKMKTFEPTVLDTVIRCMGFMITSTVGGGDDLIVI